MKINVDWCPIYLKFDEANYFLDEIRSHQQYPKLLFFYWSAFLSSARIVTLHIQKQILPKVQNGKKIYDDTVNEFLNDEICRFFIKLRNVSEKETYVPLSFELFESSYEEDDPKNVFTQIGATILPSTPSKKHLMLLEDMLMGKISWSSASYIKPKWFIENYPGGEIELLNACKTYLSKLRKFIEVVRSRLESEK